MTVATEVLARRIDHKLAHDNADLLIENEDLRCRLAVARQLLADLTEWVEAHGSTVVDEPDDEEAGT